MNVHLGDTFVNNRAWSGVPIPICVGPVCREESRMMAFTANDDRQFGSIGCRSLFCVEPFERIEDLGELLVDDGFELAL